jgi:hypothetical protein
LQDIEPLGRSGVSLPSSQSSHLGSAVIVSRSVHVRFCAEASEVSERFPVVSSGPLSLPTDPWGLALVFQNEITLPEAVVTANGVLPFDVIVELVCHTRVEDYGVGLEDSGAAVPRGLVVCHSRFDVLDFVGNLAVPTGPSPMIEGEPWAADDALSRRRTASVMYRDSCFSPRQLVSEVVEGNPTSWALVASPESTVASAGFYSWSCRHSFRHAAWPVKISEAPVPVRFGCLLLLLLVVLYVFFAPLPVPVWRVYAHCFIHTRGSCVPGTSFATDPCCDFQSR